MLDDMIDGAQANSPTIEEIVEETVYDVRTNIAESQINKSDILSHTADLLTALLATAIQRLGE
jgi:hypothetical protein